jgi:hypothetical protein
LTLQHLKAQEIEIDVRNVGGDEVPEFFCKEMASVFLAGENSARK